MLNKLELPLSFGFLLDIILHMSPEKRLREPNKNSQPYEIMLGTSFKPFENAHKAYRPEKGEEPLVVPESYDHILALRKKVRLFGFEGYIDVISEDPDAFVEMLIEDYPLAKPLGPADFKMVVSRSRGTEYVREPFILRFTFLPQTPSEYGRLLNIYADVRLGDYQYMLVWNLSRLTVKRNLKSLEAGEKILVVQKNLFDTNLMENGELIIPDEDDAYEKTEFDRISFVWLPDELRLLRTIELTFHEWDHGDDQEQPSDPLTPERIPTPILA